MGYVALYRKYRPLTFEAVAGQETIVQTIKSALAANRLSHAYLFCGPRGTGKTTIARLIAKAVNCVGDDKPCGVCGSWACCWSAAVWWWGGGVVGCLRTV